MRQALSMSVIVPAYNAEDVLPECLGALRVSTCEPLEILVVNDGSTDRTAEIAADYGATVLATARAQSGAGAARNVAARIAAGDVLVFVDADVVVQPDTLARLHQHFADHPEVAAVFGSYDAEPAAANFLSQYKNLQHHYVHQKGSVDAETFWTGCGAIRKDLFLEVGGFEVIKDSRPSIEDVELGYRRGSRGLRIKLDATIQVKHLKRWTLWQFLYTEIFCRAVPWSNLIVSRRRIPRDLNVSLRERLSAAIAWSVVCLLPLSFWHSWMIIMPVAGLVTLICLNREFYGFLLRHRGLWFVVRTLPVHTLDYLYSSLAFAICWLRHMLVSRTSYELY